MFKISSFAQNIELSMDKTLRANAGKQFTFKKLAEATDFLNAAAEIFEKAGMFEESDEILKILASLSELK